MSHHRIALLVIAAAVVLDAAAALWFAAAEHVPVTSGFCYALGVATTSGSSVPVADGAGRLVTVLMQVTIIPLFAATVSLFTSGLTAVHVKSVHARLDEMPSGLHEAKLAKLSDDVSGLADVVRAALRGPRL